MKAMIMTAGKGTRLGRITESIPKALVDINGKSVLQLAVEKCTADGFDDIIINVHHFADIVEDEVMRLNRIGFKIIVSDERDSLLETGGGLFKARKFFEKEPFLIYNVDIITDLDLKALYKHHFIKKGLATLAVRKRPGNRFFLVDYEGLLHGWCNKASGEQIIARKTEEGLNEIAFSGIHIINPQIFDYMNEGTYSLTTLYLQLATDHKISTFKHTEGYWFDIGTPEDLESVRQLYNP